MQKGYFTNEQVSGEEYLFKIANAAGALNSSTQVLNLKAGAGQNYFLVVPFSQSENDGNYEFTDNLEGKRCGWGDFASLFGSGKTNFFLDNICIELRLNKGDTEPNLKQPILCVQYKNASKNDSYIFTAPIKILIDEWQKISISIQKLLEIEDTDDVYVSFNILLGAGEYIHSIDFQIGESVERSNYNIGWLPSNVYKTIFTGITPQVNKRDEVVIFDTSRSKFSVTPNFISKIIQGKIFKSIFDTGVIFSSRWLKSVIYKTIFAITPSFSSRWLKSVIYKTIFAITPSFSSRVIEGLIYKNIFNVRPIFTSRTEESYLFDGPINRPFKDMSTGEITRGRYGGRTIS